LAVRCCSFLILLRHLFASCFMLGYKAVILMQMTQLDDERESAKDAAFAQQLDDEFDDLDKEFLREYRLKRLEELRKVYEAVYA